MTEAEAALFTQWSRENLEAPLLAQLTQLRVPSPRDDAAVRALQATLDRMPVLETFEIVCRYPRGPEVALRHHRAHLTIPAPSPWPPLDMLAEATSITIAQIVIPLRKAVGAMEKSFDKFDEPARTAWTSLWRTLESPADTLHMRAADIYTAMAELEEREAYAHEWAAQLVAALHSPALADETITVRRT